MNAETDFGRRLEQLRREPQVVARAAAARGERVIGYVGNEVPVALIIAADALPVRLRPHAQASTANADRFVESSFAPALRGIAEQWLQGGLDHLDAVVFARGDDSAQRLYYYFCELQRRGLCAGPTPLLYDVASLARPTSHEHTLDSTRLLARQLGSAARMLEAALQRVRHREELAHAVRAHRLLPAPLRGSAGWSFEFAAGCWPLIAADWCAGHAYSFRALMARGGW